MAQWTSVGSVIVSPTAGLIDVGPVTVPVSGSLVVGVRETTPNHGFHFAFGLLRFQTEDGWPLGTVRVWGSPVWEAYRLGMGLETDPGPGRLVFEPRAINLRWVTAGFPWGLDFRVRL